MLSRSTGPEVALVAHRWEHVTPGQWVTNLDGRSGACRGPAHQVSGLVIARDSAWNAWVACRCGALSHGRATYLVVDATHDGDRPGRTDKEGA